MRPVNKGTDDRDFNPYTDAQGELIDTIDEYCSYCERWLSSSAHVEHKLPKTQNPELEYRWDNFLLSCTNCNSHKGHSGSTLEEYIWPDSDNTIRAYSYHKDGVVLPVTGFGDDIDEKIQRTWKQLGLNKHPYVQAHTGLRRPTDKDRRWSHRREIWQMATRYKDRLADIDTEDRRIDIVTAAKLRGFFSVWFTVFSDDLDMKKRLINAFRGTDKECFDSNGIPIPRSGGII